MTFERTANQGGEIRFQTHGEARLHQQRRKAISPTNKARTTKNP